jgi:hypothetical protein
VTLGSSRMVCPEYRVMTADIFGENALAESNRIRIDGCRRGTMSGPAPFSRSDYE